MSPEPTRNSGHTGPTSSAGKTISSQNATKHGACSQTLILPGESEQEWLLLLARWRAAYQPAENLELDFVIKVAQAEWYRLRTQRYHDEFLASIGGSPPHSWDPADIKRHDLCLRYKTAAERSFQREYRLLEQYLKVHPSNSTRPAATPPLIQEIKVSIIGGQPRISTPLDSVMIDQWSRQAAPGALIQRVFTFPDGVPPEFRWMFPDPANRAPGAQFQQEMSFSRWSLAFVGDHLFPKGVPIDYVV